MEPLYKNENYMVVLDENSNKNYAVVNRISNAHEYRTDALPDAVGVAIGFDYTLARMLRGDVVLDSDDMVDAIKRMVTDDDDTTLN